MTVTIVSCLYGTQYDKFVDEWIESIQALNTQPAEVIIATENGIVREPSHPIFDCTILAPWMRDWTYPQAFYLDRAIRAASTEWVWILDVDDTALPDALDGIEDVNADVWVMGYITDTETYIPKEARGNQIPAGSAIRTEAYHRAGGFPDAAFQDYGLWRRLAHVGATFEISGRPHYRYRHHPESRTNTELTRDRRHLHLAEVTELVH